jgi:hypothetical protein
MPYKSIMERQIECDKSYAAKLMKYFTELYKEYVVTRVSVIVTGQSSAPGIPIEIAYSIAIYSELAIPEVGKGKTIKGKDPKNSFTHVQLANSIKTNSYSTLVAGHYTGSDPPADPP